MIDIGRLAYFVAEHAARFWVLEKQIGEAVLLRSKSRIPIDSMGWARNAGESGSGGDTEGGAPYAASLSSYVNLH